MRNYLYTWMGARVVPICWASQERTEVVVRYDDPDMLEKNETVVIKPVAELKVNGGWPELEARVNKAEAQTRGQRVMAGPTLDVGLPGHGQATHPEGDDDVGIIFLERSGDSYILRVWSDINNQEPTHKIDMSEAREWRREVYDDEEVL